MSLAQKTESLQSDKTIAYTMSRFPKVTETFVLYEMLEVEHAGLHIELYPLLRHHDSAEHPETKQFTLRARYLPFLSIEIIKSNLLFIAHSPLKYFRTFSELILKAFPSPKFIAGTLAIWAKAVHFSCDMQKNNVRHVHAHFATHATTAALIVNRLTGIPYSFTAHAHDIFMDTRMLDIKLKEAQFAVVISEFNRNWITERFGIELNSKLHTIHCGVDPTVFKPRPEIRTPGPIRLICVASFKDMKGHTYLLKACRRVLNKLKTNSTEPDFLIHLVGDGPLRTQVESEIAALNLTENVIVHGALPRKEVSELTLQADIAVMASVQGARGDMEGIPVSLMEAMCVGLPVVTTRLSGIPELVEDGVNGFLVPPKQEEPLAQAIQSLIENEELGRTMGSSGREKVLKEFDMRINSRKLVHFFNESINSLNSDILNVK
ncbi:glycosyltransferase family 4 protein [Maridesulfovibrio frigidus]|uniref:glycosyltransferase family 4 protein n=1 Tax=Maridesulfovibrio frigidus TaxID=340956 RepID=UPI00068DD5BF|nr:glycosyltransferase family 4 protein [Maridesulfovibrio frigidus]